MKRPLLVFLVALGLANACLAQVDKNRLEKAKNFVDGHVTWLMLNKQAEDGGKGINKSDLEPLTLKLDVPAVEGALDSGQLMTLLSAKYKRTIDKLSRPIASINTDGLASLPPRVAAEKLVDTAFSILERSYGVEFKMLESSKTGLLQSVILYLGAQAAPKPETVVAASTPVPIQGAAPAAKPGVGWHFFFLSLLPVVLCLVLGFFVWKLYERVQALALSQEALEKQVKTAAKQGKAQEPVETRRKNGVDPSVEISELNAQVNLLKRRVAQLENPAPGARTAPDGRPIQDGRSASDGRSGSDARPARDAKPPRREPPPPPPQEQTFYMTLPINNYFLDKSKSPTRDNTVYLFTTKPDGTDATFTVHVSGTQLTDILSRTETFIKPACVEENLPSPGTKSIGNVQPGRAVLEGDKWVIKTKAVIRYE